MTFSPEPQVLERNPTGTGPLGGGWSNVVLQRHQAPQLGRLLGAQLPLTASLEGPSKMVNIVPGVDPGTSLGGSCFMSES